MTQRPRTPFRPAATPPQRFAVHPLSIAALLAIAGSAHALPQGGTVVGGQATIQTPSTTLQVITQDSSKAIIDWRSFSIGAGEKVRFDQPSSSAVLLNRVTGYDPTNIFGQMQANGRIFLLNPQGVLFGPNARIDVGGLVASTLSLSNADFLASRYALTSTPGVTLGEVRNEGTISAPAGTVVLAGPTVVNTGSIEADRGRVGLAAAGGVLVDVEGDGLVFFNTQATDAAARLSQLGRIRADGGSVELRAAARGSFAGTVLNMDGAVQARSLGQRNGRIVIDGGGTGVTAVNGTVDARGGDGLSGGDVTLTGTHVLLAGTSRIDAGGDTGGGRIRVGGGFQGHDADVRNAQAVIVAPGAVLAADGGRTGSGGQVVVWSDVATRHLGSISARGGSAGGDGGQVEVSGLESLDFRGTVDLAAPAGKVGSLLLDPNTIEIKTGGAQTVTANLVDFEATPNTTNIDPATLKALDGLVTLQAKQTVTFTDALVMDKANASLKVQAGGNIDVKNTVSTTKGIELSANDPGGTQSNGRVEIGANLTVTGTGSVTIDNNGSTNANRLGATINATSSTVFFTGNTTVFAASAVNSGAGTTFGGTVAGAFALTVTSTGTTAFGSTVSLASLNAGGGGAVSLSDDVTTTGTQTYGPLTVGADLQLSGSSITLNGAVTATGAALTLAPTGTVTIGGDVAAASLTVSSGSTALGANVTAGDQSYGAITVTAPAAVLAGTDITLGGPVTGANGLTLTAGGTAAVNAPVTTASFTSNGTGTTTLGANVTTTGTQSYNATTLGGDRVLSASGIGFGSLNAAGNDLTLTTDALSITGATSGLAALVVQPTTATTTVGLTGGAGTLQIDQPLLSKLGGSGSTLTIGRTDSTVAITSGATIALPADTTMESLSGAVNLGTITGGGHALTFSTTGGRQIGGGSSGITTLDASGAGTTTINGNVGATVLQRYGAVTVGANSVLTAPAVTLGSVTAGANDLTVTAANTTLNGTVDSTTGALSFGNVTLGASVQMTAPTIAVGNVNGGGLNSLTLTPGTSASVGAVSNIDVFTANGAGTTTLSGNVTSAGTQNYNTAALSAPVVLTAPQITLNGTFAAGANDIAAQTDAFGGAGTFTGSANLRIAPRSAASDVAVVSTAAAPATYGQLFINGLASGGFGSVTIGRADGTGTIDVGTGSTFTLPANFRLLSQSGDVTFGGTIAGNAKTLTVDTTGTTTLGGALNNLAALTVSGPATLGGTIATTGAQSFGGAVTLNASTTLDAGTTLGLGAVTGAGNDLTLVSGSGVTLANITGVKDLSSTGGTTTLGSSITTTGTQTYGNVALNGNRTLDAGVAAIDIGGSVSGTGTLTLTATTAGSTLHAVSGITGLTVNGSATLNGNVTTTGAQDYDAVTLAANTTLAGSAVTLGTVTAGANNVAVTAANTTLNGNVTGTGTQSYGGLTLGTDVTLAGSTITVGAAVAGGAHNFTVTPTAAASLKAVTAANVTADGAGTTTLGGDVTTLGGTQTYNTATQSADVTLTAQNIVLNGAFTTGANDLAMQTLSLTLGGSLASSGSNFRLATPGAAGTIGLNSVAGPDLNISPGTISAFLGFGFGSFTLGRPDGTGAITVATGGAVTLPSNLDIVSGSGAVTLATIDGNNRALSVATGGTTSITGAISGVTTFGVTGPTSLAGNVSSSGTQTYGGTVTLAGSSALFGPRLDFTAAGNAIAIGANSLTLNTRDLNITGSVTGTGSAALGALNTVDTVSFAAAAPSTSAFTATDIGKFNTVGSLTLGRSDGSGAISVGALTLPANTTVAGLFAPVGLQGAITGANHSLSVTSLGNTTFSASPTGLSALSVSGNVSLPGGTISTTGNQNYGGNITVNGNQTLDAANIGIGGTLVLGANDLTLQYDGSLTGPAGATGTGFVSLAPRTVNATIGVAGGAGAFQVSQATLNSFAALPNIGVGRPDGTGAINVGTVSLQSNLRVQSGSGDIVATGGASGLGLAHSLTLDTGGLANLGGTFSNLSAMTVTGATRLAGATTVSTAGNGNVTFGGALDGSVADVQSLSVNSGGATVFGGPVGGGGRGLLSLTTDALGTTTLRGSVNALTTTFNDTVALDTATTTVTGTTVNFLGALDGTTVGANALTVNASGLTTFGVGVGVTRALASLTTDAAGSTRIAGGARATGAIALNDPVTLIGSGTFAGASVAFGSTLDGAQSMTVDSPGLTRFGGNVGATTPLALLVTDGPGTTTINGSVRTTGAQTFGDAVTLTAPATMTGSDVTFSAAVDGAQALVVNASGGSNFLAPVGATTPLVSMTTNAGGTTTLAGNVTTTAGQAYNDAVTLTGAATLTGTTMLFGSTVNGAQALTVNGSGTTTFAGAVGNTTPLVSLSTSAAGTTQLGGTVVTSGTQSYGDPVLLTGPTTLTGSGVAFAGSVDGAQALSIVSAGATSFGAPVGATTPLASLATNAGGTTTLTGNVTTTGTQTYGDDVALAAPAVLNASGIAFGGNLAAGAFDLTTRSNSLTLAGSASGSGALDIAPATAAGTIGLAGAPGTLQLDAALLGGLGTFSGLTIGRADGTGAITAGAFALSTPTTITGATAPVSFVGDIAGNGQPLTVTSGGTTRVAAALTGLASFTVPNAIRFDGGTVATSAAQNYAGAVLLDGNATLSASAVQFNAAVDGPGALAVTAAGGTTFAAPVGATTALASVAVTGPAALDGGTVRTTGTQAWNGAVTLGADTTLSGTNVGFGAAVDGAQALNVAASGTATFAAPVGAGTALTSLSTLSAASLAGDVTTTGAQSYGGAVTLTGDSVLAGSSASFGGSIDGAQALTSNVSGLTTFGGAVGGTTALSSLTVANAAQVNGGRLATTGAQTFGGALALGAATTASGSDLGFASTVDGPGALTANATGTLTLGAAVGGTAPLASLTATAPGGISLGGNVTTTGAQSFTGPVTLSGDVVASASGITIAGTVDGAQALQLNAAGATAITGPVGQTTALASLSTDAAGTTSLGGSVRTTGAQTYLDATTLTGDATLAGSAVTFGSTLDGAQALTVNAADTRFGAAVGATTALVSLTTDAAGTTRLGGNVTTTGAQSFGDAVQLDAAATLTAASLAFGSTLDGAQALTAAVAGNTAFDGAVGGTTALASLAVSGTTAMNAGSVTTTGAQAYTGAVTLARGTTLTATGLSFGAALDGAQALTIQNGGTTSFGAAVGATSPLASLAVDGGGPISLAGASVDTTGAQRYSGDLQLAGSTRLTGSSLSFGGNVAGAQDLQLQADALTSAGSVSGTGVLNVTPLTASTGIGIAGGAGPIQVSQAMLAASGGFTQHVIGRADGTGSIDAGALTLGANTTLQTAGGNIALNGATNGGFDLVLNSGGTTRIAGPVGTTTALRSLGTDAPGATVFDQADASGSAQVVTTGAQTYADPVSATVPVRFVAASVTATQAANRFAGGVSGTVGSLALVDSGDVVIGDLALSNGGSVVAEGTITVDGALALNGGTLALTTNATPTVGPLTDPDFAGKTPLYRNSLLQEASATITQGAASSITSAPGSLLVLRTPKNGSLLFDSATNRLLGDVSAVAGTLNDNDTSRFGTAAITTISVLRLNSSEIHVAGAPPADGSQTLQRAGFEADAIKLTADKLTTGTDGQIRARLPFDNLQGSDSSLPGLTLVMSPQALTIGGGFGTADPASWIQVKVGSTQGGFLTVRPKGQNGDNAIILLAGAEPKPFYDGAGKLTEVRVFYNGDTPRTPQETGALNAVIALVEEARRARFEEAVRTENVSSRLRSGVIAEVGSGRPATVGRESIRMPEVCEVSPGKFTCE